MLVLFDNDIPQGLARTLKVLGVYQLEVTSEIFAAQLPMFGNEDECRNHFSSVVLVEAIVETAGGTADLDSITQANPAYPAGYNQVPWDEGLLSPDGGELVARKMNCVKGTGPLRCAFYMHYWDERLPIIWKYGQVSCPPPGSMPERLRKIMPYRPCD